MSRIHVIIQVEIFETDFPEVDFSDTTPEFQNINLRPLEN